MGCCPVLKNLVQCGGALVALMECAWVDARCQLPIRVLLDGTVGAYGAAHTGLGVHVHLGREECEGLMLCDQGLITPRMA
jgi:hypothetical protein